MAKRQEANIFASHCLLPHALLPPKESIPEEYDDFDEKFLSLAKQLGISVEVVVIALLRHGQITKTQYKGYRKHKIEEFEKTAKTKEKTKKIRIPRKYRHREPLKIFGKQYVCTAIDAFHAGKITLSKLSDYLDRLKIKDIHALEHHLHHG